MSMTDQELMEFKERFGHCEVPSTWTENPPLAKWVTVQRALQSVGKLDEERRRRLEPPQRVLASDIGRILHTGSGGAACGPSLELVE